MSTVERSAVEVAQAVADAFVSGDVGAAWPHLTTELRVRLCLDAVELAIEAGIRHPEVARAMAVDIADHGPTHPGFGPIAMVLDALELAPRGAPVVEVGRSERARLVEVGETLWLVELRGGRWRVASIDGAPVDVARDRQRFARAMARPVTGAMIRGGRSMDLGSRGT